MEKILEKDLQNHVENSAKIRTTWMYMHFSCFLVIHFLLDFFKNGVLENSNTGPAVLIFVIIFLISKVPKSIIDRYNCLISFLTGEIFMWTLITYSYFTYPQYSILFAQLTGFVEYHYQAYFCTSLYLLILLCIKHFLCWVGFGLIYEKINISDPVFFFEICILSLSQQMICFFLEYCSQVNMFISRVEVKSLHEKLNTIVNAIEDYILVVSPDRKILFMNKSASMEFKEKNFEDVLKDYITVKINTVNVDPLPHILEKLEYFFSSDLDLINFEITKKEKKFVQWTGQRITWENEKVLLLTGKNISKIVELEKENCENSYRSVLINTVSHELRNPTNIIMILGTQIKESNELSQKNTEKVEILLGSCALQLCLINDLLDYAQIVARCLKISKTPFSINSLINECIGYIKLQLNPSIKFINSATNLPETIISDPNRIKQVILNLLSNSRKFTTNGYISLETQYGNSKLFITCTDTGTGIPADKLNSLFREFGKLENSLNQQGVGLGLYISNMLVRELGGKGITVQSKLGVGSCFSFYIIVDLPETSPFDVPDENNLIAVPVMDLKPFFQKSPTDKILVVDDVYFNILAYQEIFKSVGIKIKFAMNGEEAIKMVKKERFSCILMDCEMPVMNGMEATRQLLILEREGVIENLPPIIGNTAHSDPEIIDKCIRIGMKEVIVKPCAKEEIINTVKSWLT